MHLIRRHVASRIHLIVYDGLWGVQDLDKS